MRVLPVVLICGSLFIGCKGAREPYPPTTKKQVVDELYGVKIVDNYRWLDTLSNPAVRAWNDAENTYSRKYFDGLEALKPIQNRVKELLGTESVSYSGLVNRGHFFALRSQPPKNQPVIVMHPVAGDTAGERVLVDPNVIDPRGTTAIDWYQPSHNGRYVAVSLSKNGSEDGTLFVFDVETGRQLADSVPRAQFPTAGGSAEWSTTNDGFYYTRYPQGDERPPADRNFYQQIYYHKLGTPAVNDVYVLGKEFPRIAECVLSSSADGQVLLVAVENGDGGEFMHYVKSPSGGWRRMTEFSDKVTAVKAGPGNRLFLLSHNAAPNGKILSTSIAAPSIAGAITVVPESDASITDFLPAATRLYVVDMVGGPSLVRSFSLDGDALTPVAVAPMVSVGGLTRIGGDRVFYAEQSYFEPPSWFDYDPSRGVPRKSVLSDQMVLDFTDCVSVREFATSHDGTKIPVNILMKKNTPLNGRNPVILYGYGGFGVSLAPSYSPLLRLWLEQGGVYVIANLRGGGEFGEKWHEAGMLTKKQNVFDDFIACAQHLIDHNYTNNEQLAIMGGSNGGLLMGAALTQRPDLFKAVVSYVGLYDMVRSELFPNGSFNVTELGTVRDPVQFKALYAYSPYHHVQNGTNYPAVLLLSGDNDGRVDPANSRKMAARLQEATGSALPILLRTDSQAGHGIGTGLTARVAEEADVHAFLFEQLRVRYKPVKQ